MVAGDIDTAATHVRGLAAPDLAYRYAEAQYEQGLRFRSPDALRLAAQICGIHRVQKSTITMEWRFLNLRGSALLTRGERGDGAALDEAIAAFHAALESYTSEAASIDWAGTQTNLGNVLFTRGERGDEAALEEAITAYRLNRRRALASPARVFAGDF